MNVLELNQAAQSELIRQYWQYEWPLVVRSSHYWKPDWLPELY